MKKFLFLIALFTLMGGANSVKAEEGTKTPLLLLKNGVINTTDFDITPIAPSTLTTDNLYAATFTSTNGNPSNTFQYKSLNVKDYDKAIVKYTIEAGNGDWQINLPNGSYTALPIGTDQVYEVDLREVDTYGDFTVFSWFITDKSITISEVYLFKSSDPLAPQKSALQDAINKGNAQQSFAKTTASWNTLQTAISTGTTVLATSDDADGLTSATEAINDAIDGLVLQDGYTKLTKDMYYYWNSATAPTTGNSDAGACDYVLNVSTGQPYGHGSVPLLSFADLSTFDTFTILATGGTPRILLNRDIEDGQCSDVEANSHLIDNTHAGCMTWASKYFTTEGSNVTVDLKQLATDKGFAHLHTIKTVGGNVTVSDMLLYRTINIGATGYATFGSLYKNAKPNGVTAYAAKYEDGQVTLKAVTNVPAGKGVVIMGDEGSYAPTFDVEADDIDSDLKVSNGTVVGDESTIYVLANGASGIGFYLLKNGNKLEAGKAYLQIGGGSARAFIGISGMDVTGISTVKQAEGKKDDVIYNLNGQRVSNPRKGLFIKNGVKFLVD